MGKRLARRWLSGGRSILIGGKSSALIEHSIGQLLRLRAEEFGNRPALISAHQNIQLTYSELLDQARRFAANLYDEGLVAGDRVGIYATNSLEWVVAQYGCAMADFLLVNINPAYKVEDLKHALKLTEVNCVLVSNGAYPKPILPVLEAVVGRPVGSERCALECPGLPNLRRAFLISAHHESLNPDWADFGQLLINRTPSSAALARVDQATANQKAQDPTNIQFTSGTTGNPKGAVLTHLNIVNNGATVARGMGYSPFDILCLPVPLYHCFGTVMGNLAALYAGAACLYPNPIFSGPKTLDACSAYKATAVYGVPTMFIELINQQRERNLPLELRASLMAGSMCPESLLKSVQKELKIKDCIVGYGMTETSPISFLTLRGDTVENQTTTVGRLTDFLEAKIVDEQGNIVPIGEKGELCVRGYSVMKGYYNDSKATAEAIRDGWMYTGDLLQFDSQGYARVLGRLKDVIIRGGENIAPSEIEGHILKLDFVENVQIIGVPDDRLGEEICAVLKLRKNVKSFDPNEIVDYLRDKLAHFKVPKYIWPVDDIPITVTGKPLKRIMKQQWDDLVVSKGLIDKFKVK